MREAIPGTSEGIAGISQSRQPRIRPRCFNWSKNDSSPFQLKTASNGRTDIASDANVKPNDLRSPDGSRSCVIAYADKK